MTNVKSKGQILLGHRRGRFPQDIQKFILLSTNYLIQFQIYFIFPYNTTINMKVINKMTPKSISQKLVQGAKITSKRKGTAAKKKTLKKKTPRLRKPEKMGLEQWQVALRKEFGREQNFRLKNIGDDPIFSEFMVTNPKTKGEYRVAIRGLKCGDNYCSCPDFAVNSLGTCKHIEFTLAKLQRKRGGKKAFAAGFHPSYSELYVRYGAKREVIFQPGRSCPPTLTTLAGRYFDKNGVLKASAYSRFNTFLKNAAAFKHDLRCYEDTIRFVAQVRDQAHLKKEIDKVFPKGIKSAAFKKLCKVSLYPYQKKGALFAAQAGRSLLADDMGLGKTIQAVAAAEILAKTVGLDRVLIVAPTSLKHQWKQEIEKFSNRSAVVVEGSWAKRTDLYENRSFYKITNYDVIHRDLDLIHKWAPDMIILDEAQRIKNWKTRTAQSVKKLESQHALVLTGTPLENRLEELHSLVEFIDCFHLGPLYRFLHEHQHIDENGKVIGYRNLTQIAQNLKSILLRRKKDEVLKDLPQRLEKNYFVPMTSEQMKHHEENRETVARIVAKWKRFGFLSETDRHILMIALQNMRMSCNSTYLLDKKTDYGVKADELIAVLQEIFEEPRAKVVVFSQWLRTHELILRRFDSSKKSYVLFHGSVPGPKRKELIKRFKTDTDCRIFLSTDAGGLGLNLQNATAVVNMDLPWNPAVLDQRIGRVHRLGQQKTVRVVNFVAQGTIEHGMLSLLSFKKSLFAGVLEAGENEVFLGGTRMKRFMESVDKAADAIPESMPQGPAHGDQRDDPETEKRVSDKVQPPATETQQAWNEILSAGLSLLGKMGQTLAETKDKQTGPGTIISRGLSVETDKTTGQQHLKIPVPNKETIETVVKLLNDFTKNLSF